MEHTHSGVAAPAPAGVPARLPRRIEPQAYDNMPRRAYLDGWNDEAAGGMFAPRENSADYLAHYIDGYRTRQLGRWPTWMEGMVDAEVAGNPPSRALAEWMADDFSAADLFIPMVGDEERPWSMHDGRPTMIRSYAAPALCPVMPGSRVEVALRGGATIATDKPELLRWAWNMGNPGSAEPVMWRIVK